MAATRLVVGRWIAMASDLQKSSSRSTRTAGGDPVAGADPGGTRSTKPGQRDKSAPKAEAPTTQVDVTSGDRNPRRESRSKQPDLA
jgi:hypothetical protein